jgi:phage FluMu gp28-like protein
VKSARIGYSFATAYEAVEDCLSHRTTWTVLSSSKPQSVEFVQEHVGKIKESMQLTAELYEEPYADELGKTDVMQQIAKFPNGSRIIALPANPRTARGYPGNAILDEYAHTEDSYSVWAAITRQLALGHKLRVLSTPNGEQGKFFDLAKEAGLTDGMAPGSNPKVEGAWSWHWVDANLAIADGCPINLEEMQQLYKGDQDTYLQEFFCVFLKAVGAWLSLELVARAESDEATLEWPAGYKPLGRLFCGIDVGHDGDRTCLWLDERLGDVSIARLVLRLHSMPIFPKQGALGQVDFLDPWIAMCDRAAMDCTGLGIGLYDYFDAKYPAKVMGIQFAGSNEQHVKIKTAMAVGMKQRFEKGLNRIPRDMEIRQALQAIKREVTGTGVKFDAPHIEVDTAVSGGKRKKVYQHADEFWAKAMCDLAADQPGASFAEHAALVGEPVMADMEAVWA